MKISEIFQSLISEYINSTSFSDIIVGTVTSINPFRIRINDKLILSPNQLIFLKNCDTSFNIGENLAILKQSDGQKFFVIDRIINYDYEEEEKFYL